MSNRERAALVALIVALALAVHVLNATYAEPAPMCSTDRVMTIGPCGWPQT